MSFRVRHPDQDRLDFSCFSNDHIWKRLQRFCSMLLLYIATVVQRSRMPPFLFWNESCRFAPNSKFHSAGKDRETFEGDKLSWINYSRQRVCSQNLASLGAIVKLCICNLLRLTAFQATTKRTEAGESDKLLSIFKVRWCWISGPKRLVIQLHCRLSLQHLLMDQVPSLQILITDAWAVDTIPFTVDRGIFVDNPYDEN